MKTSLLRSSLAVVLTYVAMSLVIIASFASLWLGLGPDRLLMPGSFKGNLFFCITAPAITVVVGLLGGVMCAKIARGGRTPVLVLAGMVLVLGAITAAFILQKPFPSDPRPPGMTLQEMMEVGREPTWLAIFNPIGGALAVFAGGVLLAGSRKAE